MMKAKKVQVWLSTLIAALFVVLTVCSASAAVVTQPTFSVAAGTYATTQSVTISTTFPGASIYYTVDGSTPSSNLSVATNFLYSTPVAVDRNLTLKAIAVAAGNTDSSVTSAAYVIQAGVPVSNVSTAGVQVNNISVTLTSATAGASIYYTLNGTTPTASSTKYTTPIAISQTSSLKAIAIKSGNANSNVVTFPYSFKVGQPSFSPAAGTFNNTQSVTISSLTTGATLYYTIDGTTPTITSSVYSSPLTVSQGRTITAFGVKSGYTNSNVISSAYVLTAATPVSGVAGGTYDLPQTVSLTSDTTGATIFYTLDGSTPTSGSTLYSTPLNISTSLVLKAIAYKAGMNASGVMSTAYTLQATAPTANVGSNTYLYGAVPAISLSTTTPGGTIYYTLDGSTPSTSSTLYSTPITLTQSSTLKAITSKSGLTNSAVMSVAYTVQVTTPVFTPAEGAYTSAQSVTISCSTPSAAIYYTNDGTTPSAVSTLYIGTPISVTSTTTLKAIAIKASLANSSVATAVYSLKAATPTVDLGTSTYTTSVVVTLTAPTSGSSIRYTTDGSAPTASSTLYSTPLTISQTTNLKAIAVKSGLGNSDVLDNLYTIVVATPTTNVATGTYTNNQTVTVTCATPGSTIYYTLDGTTPTTSSSLYVNPFVIATTSTLKAVGYKNGLSISTPSYNLYSFKVGQPAFSPVASTYPSGQVVSISSVTTGATIYYTLNGTTPTAASSVFSNALAIDVNTTIKTFAKKAGYTDSNLITGSFIIQAAVPAAEPPAGSYTTAQTVSLTTTTAGATIYYTLNGATPTTTSSIYSTPLTIATTKTLKAVAIKAGMGNSGIMSALYNLDKVATPTVSPIAGTYAAAQTVSLSSATVGASIYYTTNGATPTTSSSLYSAAITVSQNTTLKAIAAKTGMVNSDVLTAAYLIKTAKPVSSKATGTYVNSTSVSLTTTTVGGSIYYTLDGSTPTTASTLFNVASPILVNQTLTLKAITAKTGMTDSDVLSVLYTITPAAPTANVAAGTYTNNQSVSLASTTAGSSIYYTLDGSAPTTSSTLYSNAVVISQTSTLKAIAAKAGLSNSTVLSVSYTLKVGQPAFGPIATTYATPQAVALTSATAGATIYYTVNGTTPTAASSVYVDPIAVDVNTTIKAFGKKTGYTDSNLVTGTYIIQAGLPTANPPAGSYGSVQNVTLSSATSGATIYYTLNGTTPTTTSSVYSTPLVVATTKTIKAMAVKTGMGNSAIMSAAYNLDKVATPIASPVAGTYTTAQTVSLSTTTAGATIFYTVNGSTPTGGSSVYTTPFAVSQNTTVKAIGMKTGFISSDMMTAAYLIKVDKPTASAVAGTYITSKAVTLSTATVGGTIYYTLDGTTPTTASTQYVPASTITISQTTTLKAITAKTGFTNSDVLSVLYTIAPAAPTADIAAGTYTTAQRVSLTCATAGSSIFYTMDGSTPTSSSTAYTGAIDITQTTTLKALATKTGLANSSVSSFVYTLKVGQPSFTPVAGTYPTTQNVVIGSATPGATIYYTLNGTVPTAASSVYSIPLAVDVNTTVKAFAKKTGYTDSNQVTGSYIIQAGLPAANPVGGTYTTVQTVSLTSATPGATIYYTINGLNPTTSSSVYTTALTISSNTTLKAFAVKAGMGNSAIITETYTLSKVATPTATPAAGNYTTAQNVTLQTTTAGASIYYTLNGTTPTTASSLYSAPIAVAQNTTIKAIGAKSGSVNSDVFTAAYTIQAATPTADVVPGTYDVAQTVSLATATAGASIYYTMDGSTPTASSTLYANSITVNSSATIKAIAVKTNMAASAVLSVSYTLKAATPTASAPLGTYISSKDVSLSTATVGAEIRYTTNGDTPTALSPLYTTTLTFTQTTVLKAIAIKGNLVDSNVFTATYTIQVAPAVADPVSGTYDSAQIMTLTTPTAGATIYYTLNGTTPTTSSSVFSGSLAIATTSTVKSIAAKAGCTSSTVTTITYTIQAIAPVIAPTTGTFTTSKQITMSTTSINGAIYYTLDGSTPTAASTLYSTPFDLTASATIKAVTVKSGVANSTVTSASITIQAASPTASIAAGTYEGTQSITLSDATPGVSIRYTLDGSTPTATSTLYTGAISIAQTTTLKALAVKAGLTNSAVFTATYSIRVVSLVANPVAGTYNAAQNVTLSTTTPGVSIYYTINGANPTTTSSVYTGSPITISTTTTLKAFAVKAGMVNSNILSNIYTIKLEFIKLTGGENFTAALRSDGKVYTHGDNTFGQLGDGTTTADPVPAAIASLSNVTGLASGNSHVLALMSNGTVYAWGKNDRGQLGNGNTTNQSTPVLVTNLSNVVAVSAGIDYSLALKSDGTVWAWGDNTYGQLGTDSGTTPFLSSADQVLGLTGIEEIAAGGNHALALDTNTGTVYSWGDNLHGQLGNNSTTPSFAPVSVTGLTSVAHIAAGESHSLALNSTGAVFGWGYNTFGQIGDSTNIDKLVPTAIASLASGVTQISAGMYHSMALLSAGTVKAWGDNSTGALGDNTLVGKNSPVTTNSLTNITLIGNGWFHSMASRSTDKKVLAWGSNQSGQLGDGTTTNRSVATLTQLP